MKFLGRGPSAEINDSVTSQNLPRERDSQISVLVLNQIFSTSRQTAKRLQLREVLTFGLTESA